MRMRYAGEGALKACSPFVAWAAPSCRNWQRRTLRLPRQHRDRCLRARQRAPPPAREARGSGRRLHVSRSRGGVGHRSRATVFRLCEELEGKPKIGDPETRQSYNISVVPGELPPLSFYRETVVLW
eukprot:scaffold6279_cov228-Isochrysis_galbana.AAC.13